MGRVGKVSFHVQNQSDLFLELEVYPGGEEESSEQSFMVVEPGFEQFFQFLSGRRPEFIQTDIDGDSSVINGIFRGENFTAPFTLYLYVEYEEVEKLASESEQKELERKPEDNRVHL